MTARRYRIDQLCTLVRGLSPTLKTQPGPYPLVVTAEFRRSADHWQIEGPAVCVPLISSTGHGDAALHRVHYQEGRFALANLLVALIPRDPEVLVAKYLYYLLSARKDDLLVPLMLGTANVSLKERDIAGVEIPLPPLEEQRRIVNNVSAIASALDAVDVLTKQIDDEAQAILAGEFFRIAGHAPRRRMGDVAPLVRRPVVVVPDERYPELGIRSFGKGTFHKPAINGLDVGTKRVFWIESNDLLFSNVFAWEGAIAVARDADAGRVGSHRFITCIPRAGVATSQFLCFYFLTALGLEVVGAASPGGAGRNRTLGLTALAEIEVPVPPYEDQLRFGKLIAEVAALRVCREETRGRGSALAPAVLDRAFAG